MSDLDLRHNEASQDTIQIPVLEVLREWSFREIEALLQQLPHQPILISLPERPEADSAFTSEDDFDRLLSLGFTWVIGFVAPPDRIQFIAEQAARIGVECHSLDELQFDDVHTGNSPIEEDYASAVPERFIYRDGEGGLTKFPIRLMITAMCIIGLFTLLVVPFLSANTDPTTILHVSTTASSYLTQTQAGTLQFVDSGLIDPATTVFGSLDRISLSFRSLPTPDAGMEDTVWHLPDTTDHVTQPLLLGTLQHGQKTLTYASPSRRNLLMSYSRVLIAEQPIRTRAIIPPQNPKTWQAQGAFPVIPEVNDEERFTLLDHLRHLLAADPTLQDNGLPGGLIQWMARNTSKEAEWASAAQGGWHGMHTTDGDRELVDQLLTRIVDYLDGSRFVAMDVPVGTPLLVSPPSSATIGLIDRVPHQIPEGLLLHIAVHLSGVASAPGHTAAQAQQAAQIDAVIEQMVKDLQTVRQNAATLLTMSAQELRQSRALVLLDQIKNLTTMDESGWFDVRLNANVGGVTWINSMAERLAVLPITRIG